MNDTPSTPDDELEEDLELTPDESDDVAGGFNVDKSLPSGQKIAPGGRTPPTVTPVQSKIAPGADITQKVVPGDGSV